MTNTDRRSDSARWQCGRIEVWSGLAAAVMAMCILVALGQVLLLKISPDARLHETVAHPTSRTIELGRRGDLLDRRGRLIASSRIGYRLFVDPQHAATVRDFDPTIFAMELAARLDADPAEIDRRLHVEPHVQYVRLRELLTDAQLERLRMGEPMRGVGLEPRLVREFHHAGIGAMLVGHVDHDGLGRSGIERRFHSILSPQNGETRFLRDRKRRPLWVEPNDHRPSRDGGDVRLSIDLVLQQILEDRLALALRERNAGGVRGIIADPRTGEILAMHDAINGPRPGIDGGIEDPFREINPAIGRNRCVTDQYEPGSTFKPFAWAIATQLGVVKPEEVLQTPIGPAHRTSYGRSIRDDWYYGPSDWRKVLIKSLNSGMAIVSERMTHEELRTGVQAFGFGTPTRSGIPGEINGFVQTRRAWSNYTQSSVVMGHEIAVTPVQMVRAFSVFCRDDGSMVHLRTTAADPGERVVPFTRRVINPEIARLTREVLRDVMLEGTGRRAESDTYRIFGKTGTAELTNPKGGIFRDRYTSSFIAGAPLEDPRLIVLVILDDPDRTKGDYKGGSGAAPVARDIIDASLDYLGVAPDKPGVRRVMTEGRDRSQS